MASPVSDNQRFTGEAGGDEYIDAAWPQGCIPVMTFLIFGRTQMNAKHLIAVVSVLAAGSTFAQEFVAPDAGFVSTKTRAEVIAELQQARADGSLEISEYGYPVIPQTGTPKTRAEVVAEVEQARADGTLNISEYGYPFIQASRTTQASVQAETNIAQTSAHGAL
jgi:hypothetical protein